MVAMEPAQPSLIVPDVSPDALAAVTAEIAASAAEYDASAALPVRGLEIAHRAGLLTATVARRYGGPELDPLDVIRIIVALGEGDASVALLVANNLNVHSSQAHKGQWPEKYYADLLRRSAAGPALANTVRAEPELGTPARGGIPGTIARRTEDGWSLTGRKEYASGGPALAYHVVWVTVDEPGGDPDRPRVGHLVVPGDLPGITWLNTWDHLGLRASNTHDVVYDDVRVPADAFMEIPRGADGVYRDGSATLGMQGFNHAALYVGVARAARTAFAKFTHERVPGSLGRPIATTEHIQTAAGEIDAQITQAETLMYGAMLRSLAGDTTLRPQLPLIKVQIARSVVAAVNTAVASLGNFGLTRHQPFERLLRDALCVRVHPPQEDSALLSAGRRVLVL